MLYSADPELAQLLAAWPVAEARIIHLYELDPTHIAAQPAENKRNVERRTTPQTRSTLPFCLLADEAPAAALLELDPVHVHAH